MPVTNKKGHDMNSFLDSIIPGIRCQNEACQAVMGDRSISLRTLLYGECTCQYCGWEYEGALVSSDPTNYFEVEIDGTDHEIVKSENSASLATVVGSGSEQNKDAMPLDKMNRAQLVGTLNDMMLKLDDVPVSGKTVTNGDIKDYIISKR